MLRALDTRELDPAATDVERVEVSTLKLSARLAARARPDIGAHVALVRSACSRARLPLGVEALNLHRTVTALVEHDRLLDAKTFANAIAESTQNADTALGANQWLLEQAGLANDPESIERFASRAHHLLETEKDRRDEPLLSIARLGIEITRGRALLHRCNAHIETGVDVTEAWEQLQHHWLSLGDAYARIDWPSDAPGLRELTDADVAPLRTAVLKMQQLIIGRAQATFGTAGDGAGPAIPMPSHPADFRSSREWATGSTTSPTAEVTIHVGWGLGRIRLVCREVCADGGCTGCCGAGEL